MILNIYKPKGITSFNVVSKVRKALNTKKVGHAGTLDPLAEGVLIILTDKDTKKQNEFMQMEKEYVADIAFGATSESYDLESDLNHNHLEEFPEFNSLKDMIERELPLFLGQISQTVPAFSAVKVGGQRLYKRARKGDIEKKDLPKRNVKVYEIELLSLDVNEKLKLPVAKIRIVTSSGFYVRSFAHDLGARLSIGAVLVGLLRSRVGEFLVEESKEISSLTVST